MSSVGAGWVGVDIFALAVIIGFSSLNRGRANWYLWCTLLNRVDRETKKRRNFVVLRDADQWTVRWENGDEMKIFTSHFPIIEKPNRTESNIRQKKILFWIYYGLRSTRATIRKVFQFVHSSCVSHTLAACKCCSKLIFDEFKFIRSKITTTKSVICFWCAAEWNVFHVFCALPRPFFCLQLVFGE